MRPMTCVHAYRVRWAAGKEIAGDDLLPIVRGISAQLGAQVVVVGDLDAFGPMALFLPPIQSDYLFMSPTMLLSMLPGLCDVIWMDCYFLPTRADLSRLPSSQSPIDLLPLTSVLLRVEDGCSVAVYSTQLLFVDGLIPLFPPGERTIKPLHPDTFPY